MSISAEQARQIEAHEPGADTLREWTGSPIAEYLSDIIRTPGYHGPGEGCDDTLTPAGFCEGGHIQVGARSPCTNRGCPHHWPRWRREAARSMVERLAAARYLAGEGAERRLVHLVTSPPQDKRWTTTLFWEQRKVAYEKAEEAGARGAYCIPHAYRPSDAGNELWADLGGPAKALAGTVERGKWREFREAAGDDWAAMKPLIEVAPHFHQPALARDIDGETAKEIEAATGWTVGNIRSLAPFYVDESEVPPMAVLDDSGRIVRSKTEVARQGYESMARLAFYILEHGSVQPETGDLPRRNTVTSWGEVNTVNPEDLPPEVWAEIQRRVDEALPGRSREEGEEGEGVRRCQRDGCEEPVRPISELVDRMADPDHTWWEGLDFDQQCECLGAAQWMSHKPPPGIAGVGGLPPGGFERSPRKPAGVETPEEWIEWLRRLGRARVRRLDVPFLTATMQEP